MTKIGFRDLLFVVSGAMAVTGCAPVIYDEEIVTAPGLDSQTRFIQNRYGDVARTRRMNVTEQGMMGWGFGPYGSPYGYGAFSGYPYFGPAGPSLIDRAWLDTPAGIPVPMLPPSSVATSLPGSAPKVPGSGAATP